MLQGAKRLLATDGRSKRSFEVATRLFKNLKITLMIFFISEVGIYKKKDKKRKRAFDQNKKKENKISIKNIRKKARSRPRKKSKFKDLSFFL